MTQPLNKATDCRTVGRSDGDGRRFPSGRPTVRLSGAVLASIPIANRTRPHPASQLGIPVARSARATAYTSRDSPGVVRAASVAPRTPATASTDTVLAFDRDRDRVSGIEGVPQARDEGADALAVGAEVAHRATQRPGRALHGQGDLLSGERAAQPPQPVHRRLAGPAQRPRTGTRR